MSPRPARKPSAAIVLVLAMALGLLALSAVPGLRPRDVLVRHWRAQLATVSDEEALPHLRKTMRLGEVAIPILVEALGSRRQSIADAARIVLTEEIDRWRLENTRTSTPKVARLARCLAEHVDRLSPAGRSVAADLATRVLLWPIDRSRIDGSRLVTDCERVLRAAARRTAAQPITVAEAARREPSAAARRAGWVAAERTGEKDAVDIASSIAEMSHLPGGGLPVEVTPIPAAPPSLDELTPPRVDDAAVGSGAGDRRDEYAAEEKLPRDDVPPRELNPALARPLHETLEAHDAVAGSPPAIKRTGAGKAADVSLGPLQLVDLGDVDVMRRLHASDSSVVRIAREELIRRGYDELHLALAERLADPDPTVRRQLAEHLPQIAGVDAKAWLMQLARDEDDEVRRTAAAILATTGDPKVLRWLRSQGGTTLPARLRGR